MQLESRERAAAARELEQTRRLLGTDLIDVVTFYYVEAQQEWDEIAGAGGAMETLEPPPGEMVFASKVPQVPLTLLLRR